MTDRDALYRTILARPDDDLTRLVFADWLDENGDPEFAEFIRVQVAFSRHPCGGSKVPGVTHFSDTQSCQSCNEASKLDSRVYQLWHDQRMGRRYETWYEPASRSKAGVGAEVDIDIYRPSRETSQFVVRRGFVAEMWCDLNLWVGRTCSRCGGRGQDPRITFDMSDEEIVCDSCCGDGWFPGIGPQVVATHPIEVVFLREASQCVDRQQWSSFLAVLDRKFALDREEWDDEDQAELLIRYTELRGQLDRLLASREPTETVSEPDDPAVKLVSDMAIAWAKLRQFEDEQ